MRKPVGRRSVTLAIGGIIAVAASCTLQDSSKGADSANVVTGATGSRARGWNPETWRPPVVDSTPDDPFEVSVFRGLSIITHVHDSLPAYTNSNLNCTSCHLDEGRRGNAAPLVGVFARFPKYMDRSNAVVPIEDRINYCFTRSLAGSKLPADSREMQDIVAYLAYISRGVPNGEHVKDEGMAKMPPMTGDSARGRTVFVDNCARCHGNNGGGMGPIPALWGPRSFSIGASMARVERAASFIRHNMPWDRPGTLTDAQAYDVAAYITSLPRPDSPGKETDWPQGGAPADVPYGTKGHKAFHPPKLIPRTTNPSAAIVAAPASVLRR
ncbi:MAG TPA: c-type cytochrome [Gemmatimonadaceae bacterium]|nr:c-type cytochrome [Gemmatimonadaceae bacterium]